jgi:3-deoxy-7-phosphoheptulonate synthase
MPWKTDDVRIAAIHELSPPAHLIREFPCTDRAGGVVHAARAAVHHILHGEDDRLVVVVGPCSIHDVRAAREYAGRLAGERARLGQDLELVMRVYFEKPRTTVGWKGLINDPALDGTFQINRGLRLARELLLEVTELGLPAGCEYLDMITPQYLADLVSWGAIGARTTESQVHRELASGLSCPVGFKNGTDGNVRIAVDAIRAARQPHHFLSVTKGGHSAIVATNGNEDGHLILRGGTVPNYDAASVASACAELARAGLEERVMVDASHANSRKDAQNQLPVCDAVAAQLAGGERRIIGVMVESHLVAGRQDLAPGRALAYGQSITDACLGWEDTVRALDALAAGVRQRRAARA